MPRKSKPADEPIPPEEPETTTASAGPGGSEKGGLKSEEKWERNFRMRRAKQFHDRNWGRKYQMLLQFRAAHGHCRVPHKYSPNVPLAEWVQYQRKRQKRGKLSPEKKACLDKVGFLWSAPRHPPVANAPAPPPMDAAANKMFETLLQFRAARGHCNVPHEYPPNVPLAEWVRGQGTSQERGRLRPERMARLDEVGFLWSLPKEPIAPVLPPVANAPAPPPMDAAANDRREDRRGSDSRSGSGSGGSASSPVPIAPVLPPVANAPALPPLDAAANDRREDRRGSGSGSGSGSSVESLLVEASLALGRSRDDALPHVARLEHQWLLNRKQLRRMDVDTLARFIPYGLAEEALNILDREQHSVKEGFV